MTSKIEQQFFELDVSDVVFTDNPISNIYIAGFIDGNGSICIKKGGDNNFILCLDVTQCNPLPLLHLQNKYGGTIMEKKENNKQRNQFRWSLNGKYTETIFNDIKDHVIIESRKIVLALEFLQEFKADNKTRMNELFVDIRGENKLHNIDKPYIRVCHEYIGGLFDAHGCIGLTGIAKKYNLSTIITQKGDEVLLQKINDFIGFGKVNNGRYSMFSAENVLTFLGNIRNVVIEKRVQLEYTTKVLEGKYKDNYECKSFIDMVVNDKHIITKLKDIMDFNQRGKDKMKSLADTTISVKKMERFNENNKARSDKMKGVNNPNFGVERSVDHCDKIALGAALAKAKKRKFTDENMDTIMEMVNNNISRETIADQYGLTVNIISDIMTGKIDKICNINIESVKNRKAKKEVNKQFTKGENVSRNKRKISAVTVLNMIRYKIANPNATAIFICNNSNELFNVDVTVNQVRSYLGKIIKLKQLDFDKSDDWVEYETYLNA